SWWPTSECRAPGLPPELSGEEEESEVQTSGSDPVGAEEMHDLDGAYEELEQMKQRLLELRKLLLNPAPTQCEKDYEGDREDVSFKTFESLQLVELRRKNCQLRCQLKDLVQHLHNWRKEFAELEGWRCELRTRIQKMDKQLTDFDKFKVRAIEHFGLCIERWEQMKTSKLSNTDYQKRMREVVAHADNSRRSLVSLKCHKVTRHHIRSDLSQIRIILHNLFDAMMNDFRYFSRQMGVRYDM
ncbi:hypothetical protein KR018_008135, partial [Drosophila ironensis]